MFDAGRLEYKLIHSAEHYNTRAWAIIPEYWEAVLIISRRLANHLGADRFTHFRIYGTSQKSAEDAVQDLRDNLDRNNIKTTELEKVYV